MENDKTLPKPTRVQPTYSPYKLCVGRFRASKGKAAHVAFWYPIFSDGRYALVSSRGNIDYGRGPRLQAHLRNR